MTETFVRLLVCPTDKSIEEMPDFDGPPQYDQVLQALVAKHERKRCPTGSLLRVEESKWQNPEVQNEVRKRIAASFGDKAETGLGTPTYQLMETLRDDAMKCFQQHNRNPACNDYKSDSKRLVPDTKAERKELGMDPKYDAQDRSLTRYLCEWCPVHSLVQQAARAKAGLYK